MRRFALIAVGALALAGLALAAPASWSESQATTRAVPTTATEGFGTGGIRGFRVTICADRADGGVQTLLGTGTLDMWARNPDTALWAENPGLSTGVTVSGQRCQILPDFDASLVNANNWKALPVANGVGVDGGTTVTVTASFCSAGSTGC